MDNEVNQHNFMNHKIHISGFKGEIVDTMASKDATEEKLGLMMAGIKGQKGVINNAK